MAHGTRYQDVAGEDDEPDVCLCRPCVAASHGSEGYSHASLSIYNVAHTCWPLMDKKKYLFFSLYSLR